MGGYIFILVLLVAMWFLLIRPQRRRQLEAQRLVDSLEVGDEIVTAGGLYGRVVGVGDDELLVEIAPGTNVRIARRAVAGLVGEDDEEEVGELESGDEAEPVPEPAAEAAPEKPS